MVLSTGLDDGLFSGSQVEHGLIATAHGSNNYIHNFSVWKILLAKGFVEAADYGSGFPSELVS